MLQDHKDLEKDTKEAQKADKDPEELPQEDSIESPTKPPKHHHGQL